MRVGFHCLTARRCLVGSRWATRSGKSSMARFARPATRLGFLTSTTEWGDYELHVEFRAAAATNSGVFLRTPMQPTNPASDCYELNIAPPDNPFPTGSFVGRHKADNIRTPSFPSADEWHTFDVTAEGDTITVTLDGEQLYRISAIRRRFASAISICNRAKGRWRFAIFACGQWG